MTREEYINQNAAVAIQSTYGTGLFPSVKLAQGIIESGNSAGQAGESSLAKKYNAHFGIKANSKWKGKSVNLATGEYFDGKYTTITDGFRVYNDRVESYYDHTKFLQDNPRYANALNADTPEAQAQGLQSAGYATAPQYANHLISIINQHNLKRFDKQKKPMQRIEIFLGIVALVIILYFITSRMNIKLF
ncbi:glucosaminidase domain-containing protein [Oscillatoria amoena NRMC-F 0135]|nr:glucosaminidase domain-containing protein [Oscillatoria amoena NRMC-F 0135]